MNAADPVTVSGPVTSPAAKLQSALMTAAPFKDGCEAALESALAEIDGFLLFQLQPEADDDDRWVGAVMLGSGEERSMNIVTLTVSDGSASVETVESSQEPLARIVPAYAAVLTHLRPAA
jgi:hypothetical protein